MNATVESGGELVISMTGAANAIENADLVITGEGSADAQTLMGKLPNIVLKHAQAAHVPVVLLAGCVRDKEALLSAGFSKVININDGFNANTNMLEAVTASFRLTQAASQLL